MTYYGYVRAHGYGFQAKSDHSQRECAWCQQAKEVAVSHMRDATLKTTKSTKHEPDETPHAVHLTRIGRDSGVPSYSEDPLYGHKTRGLFASRIGAAPLSTTINFMDAEGKFGLSGTYVRQNAASAEPKQPVVLDMTEAEAALVLDLLAGEVDDATAEADNHYTNGSGFEGECAEARQRVGAAEALEDRLRKLLGKHLDRAYAGELES
jgi:hypothetical protein